MVASLHVLPVHRHTKVALEPGENRIPVDHQVKGQRVRYWRKLRASETTRWETFPQFPLVLNEDGSPWAPACLFLLDRARTKPLSVSTWRPLAEGLVHYKRFLDDRALEWDDFSSPDKLLRPTYLYKSYVESLVKPGGIKRATAARRISTVVIFYRWLRDSDKRLNFAPQNEPWAESSITLQYRDDRGFAQAKEVVTTDLSVKVPSGQYAYDKTIDDGGKLMPLSRDMQQALVAALKELGNPEYELMHYVSLMTGARVQTVLTLRWGLFARPPGEINSWPFKIQCGPGTGIDTKGNKADVWLSVGRYLYERLHTYATSERAKKRRERSKFKHAPHNYLFLGQQGGPYYLSKDDINEARHSENPMTRSSPTGQNLRTFIKEKVIPLAQTNVPGFRYQFHDLRATFGLNWVDANTKDNDSKEQYTFVREQLRKLMWHARATTTDRYLEYRRHHHMLERAEEGWSRYMIDLIESAGPKDAEPYWGAP